MLAHQVLNPSELSKNMRLHEALCRGFPAIPV